MDISLSPAFYAAATLYALSAALYFGVYVDARPWATRTAKWVLFAAWIAHAGDIASRDLSGVHPGTSVREALGAMSWLVVGGYLAAGLRYRLAVLGSFVAPVALGLLAVARLTPSGEELVDLTLLGRVHISLATLGVGIFAFATALATMYVLEERNLKRKRFDRVLFKRGVALETLDTLAHRLVLVGFPVFTVAMVLGVMWVSQRQSGFDRPEYGLALVTWVTFGGLIVARTASGWRGRKAALLTIGGFVAALLVIGIYLARRAFGA